nr:polyprotein [porcine birnavirus]
MTTLELQNRVVPFLKSLLLPAAGPASIPDDTLEKHTLRSETSTYNLMVGPTGSGLLVFFPGFPGSIVGAHYTWQQEGKYKFDQMLRTAQSLPANYNYCRLVSRSATIRSSTLPGGVYALNGTINAVTFQGSLSELTDISYNGLMSASANINDKIGNVLVGDGVTVLSLPTSYDLPYVRMGDPIPGTFALKDGAATCDSSDRPRIYTVHVSSGGTITQTQQEKDKVQLFNVNIDAMTSFSTSGALEFTTTLEDQSIELELVYYGLGGEVVHRTQMADGTPITRGVTNIVNLSSTVTTDEISQPITSVTLMLTMDGTDAKSLTIFGSMTFSVHGGNYPGSLRPVTMVAYEKVAAGSVLTISGVSNFELIPNPELAKNLSTDYGRFDPQAMNYTKLVLSERDRLGIRTVWSTKEYLSLKDYLLEVTDLGSPLKIAGAFGFKDLIRAIRKVAVPIISTIFPTAAPLATAIGEGVDQLIGQAASGKARAASGKLRNALAADDPNMQFPIDGIMATPGVLRTHPAHQRLIRTGATIFPVIVTTLETQDTPRSIHGKLYAAIRGNRQDLMNPSSRGQYALTLNGKKVHGYKTGTRLKIKLSRDMTVIPIDDVYEGMILPSNELLPPVEGQSGNLALKYLDIVNPPSPVQIVMTGVLNNRGEIDKVAFRDAKMATAHRLGLYIAGPGNFDIDTGNTLHEFMENFPHSESGKMRRNYMLDCYLAPLGNRIPHCALAAEFADTPELAEAISAMKAAAEEDPLFDKALSIVAWMEENDLINQMFSHMAEDSSGEKLRALLKNPTGPTVPRPKAKVGPTPEEAQRRKDEKISDRMISLGYYFVTPEWVGSNGHRGPSPGQLKFWQTTQEIPQPDNEYPEYIHAPKARHASTATIRKLAESIYGGDPPEQFIDAVNDVFEANRGRGPNPEQMQELRIIALEIRKEHKPRKSSRVKPKQSSRWLATTEEELE